MKKAILVLGPPRSGTSVVSHVIHKLGVDFGSHDRFVDPQEHVFNPIFFELQSLNDLNDGIFSYFIRSFSKLDWMPQEEDFDEKTIVKFEEKILNFIKEEFSGGNTIGLKDPRFCFTLPLWSMVLKRLGFDVYCVLTRRESNAVFESNIKINKASPAYNFRLLAQSTLLARQFVVGKKYVMVRYEELLADPIPTILYLCEGLGLDRALIGEARSVIREDLNHQKRKSDSFFYSYFESVIDSESISPDEHQRYREIFLAATFEKDQEIASLSQTLSEREEQLASRSQILSEREEQLASHSQTLGEREEQITSLNQALVEHDATINNLNQAVQTLTEQVAKRDAAVADRDVQINQLYAEVGNFRDEVDSMKVQVENYALSMETILESFSWKFTAPLRWISLNAKKLKCKTMPVLYFLNRQYREIKKSSLFDTEYYLDMNPDVAESGVDPLIHYMTFGANEGRNPNPLFDTGYYLRRNRDVAESGMNPLAHYAMFGAIEGRIPHPEKELNYLGNYSQHRFSQLERDNLKTVDIVICCHNEYDDLRECLYNLSRSSQSLYNLILVDDGSYSEMADYVKRFAKIHHAKHIRNDEAIGYPASATKGLKASTADLVILLNADTLPTRGWVDKVLECANSDKKIGIVGVLSSTASWQSVPTVFDSDDDWALNPIPDDFTLSEFASILDQEFKGFYPRLPFINGFCYAIKRKVIEDIGLFEYQRFPHYGEENDYSLRAGSNGWQCAVAADAYVYHKQGKGYTNEKRLILARKADDNLAQKHGKQFIANLGWACRNSLPMHGCRMWTTMAVEKCRIIRKGLRVFGGYRVSFILPAVGGGGVAVILQEAAAMAKMGVAVEILNLQDFRQSFLATNNINPDDTPVKLLFFETKEALLGHLQRSAQNIDAVICTHHSTVHWLAEIHREEINFTVGYYIQDFEPDFFPEVSTEYVYAEQSYKLFENIKYITKTRWNHNILSEKIGCSAEVIGPSVNLEIFQPRKEKNYFRERERIALTAMVRPSTARRAPEFTYKVLKTLAESFKDQIKVYCFGCSNDGLKACVGSTSDRIYHLDMLDRKEMSNLLNDCDIFLDLSEFQAMGLTTLEAMACGCAVVVPQNGGSLDFCDDGRNAVIVDSSNFDEIIGRVSDLINDFGKREMLQFNAVEEASKHFPEKAAFNFLKFLFE